MPTTTRQDRSLPSVSEALQVGIALAAQNTAYSVEAKVASAFSLLGKRRIAARFGGTSPTAAGAHAGNVGQAAASQQRPIAVSRVEYSHCPEKQPGKTPKTASLEAESARRERPVSAEVKSGS